MSTRLQNNLWKFTIVNNVTLVSISNIYCQGSTYESAKNNLYNVFPRELFSIESCLRMPKSLVLLSPITNHVTNLLNFES